MNERRALERALRGSPVKMAIIGLGIVGLGLFMILLHAARLDPDTARWPLAGVVVLYSFGGLFALVGLAGLYVLVIKGGDRARAILRALDVDPASIESVEPYVIQAAGAQQLPGGQHGVRFRLRGRNPIDVMTSKAEAETILRYVASRAPHALSAKVS